MKLNLNIFQNIQHIQVKYVMNMELNLNVDMGIGIAKQIDAQVVIKVKTVFIMKIVILIDTVILLQALANLLYLLIMSVIPTNNVIWACYASLPVVKLLQALVRDISHFQRLLLYMLGISVTSKHVLMDLEFQMTSKI